MNDLTPITSAANPRLKLVRRLQNERRTRQRERAFVLEGTRAVADLLERGVPPLFMLVTPGWLDSAESPLLNLAPHTDHTFLVSDDLLRSVSDLETPPGILAVAPMPDWAVPPAPRLLLVLDQIRNPGNLGTLLRTAAAAGVDAVLLAPGCVDPFNPKVVRGAMGAHLRLPVVALGWDGVAAAVAGLQVCIAAADGARDYTAVDWRRPSALIIGNEAFGVGHAALALGGTTVTIAMAAATESLNAAAAAAVILFEAARQQRAA